MTDLRTAAQQALEALAIFATDEIPEGWQAISAITALRAALAEPVQEPVAWMYVNRDGECEQIEYEAPPDDPSITPLYTAPPQRKPLTEEEIRRIKPVSPDLVDFRSGVRCAERAHGIGDSK